MSITKSSYQAQYRWSNIYTSQLSKPWTNDQDRIVKDHKISYKQIAKQLGRTYKSVQSRSQYLKRHSVMFM